MIRYLKRGKDMQVRSEDDVKVRSTVEGIIKDIEVRGDVAVREYSRKFDYWDSDDFRWHQFCRGFFLRSFWVIGHFKWPS
jgi:sulfopropanediol 3-dehydrogenase